MKTLLIVDPQNDFTSPNGSLYINGSELASILIEELIWGEDYGKVFVTQDWHPKETIHWEKWPVHCVASQWGSNINIPIQNAISNSMPVSKVFTIKKGTEPGEDGYSGFHVEKDGQIIDTELDNLLKKHDVNEIDVCGFALDVCVKETILDAVKLGYKVNLILAATASISFDGLIDTLSAFNEIGVNIVGANTMKEDKQ